VGCTNSIRARIKTLGSPDSYGETELCAPRNAYRSRSRFTTGIDTAISQGSAVEDSLPDVSGSRIVFNRLSAFGISIYSLQVGGGTPTELAPIVNANRESP
jgi:hypothetical protein